jgi:hypothetical protein
VSCYCDGAIAKVVDDTCAFRYVSYGAKLIMFYNEFGINVHSHKLKLNPLPILTPTPNIIVQSSPSQIVLSLQNINDEFNLNGIIGVPHNDTVSFTIPQHYYQY